MKSKTKKNNSINISVSGYENKAKCPIYASKKRCEEENKVLCYYQGFKEL